MMTPMFLNKTSTNFFDHSHEDQHQQVLKNSPFYSSSISASGISSLHLEQGLGMSATHSMSDQSLSFDLLEGSNNTFLNMVLPTHGVQMISAHYNGSQSEIFNFKQQEDQEPNSQNNSKGIATDNGSSLRWMTSKMRMMRKMINSNNTKSGPGNGIGFKYASNNPDHGPQITANIDTNNDNNGIRVCSDCNTTKTPLWRTGPQGPKTLCNACGIRQRKARKAAMEALSAGAAKNIRYEAASSSTSSKTSIKLKINKEKNKSRGPSNSYVSKHINKKQKTPNKQEANQLVDSDHNNSSSTTSNSSKRQIVFEEFAVNMLSKNAAFHRMFPKDEEEGALLLMALSYGLIET